jgi:hypothetical protein
MDEPTYEIQELVDLSGVSRRNIYFYVQQGVLNAPQGAGLAARYQEEHLLRLRLIPQLRREGLRLDQIRQKFGSMDLPAFRRMLEAPAPAPVPPSAPFTLPMKQKIAPDWVGSPPGIEDMPGGMGRPAAFCQRYDLPGGMILIVPQKLSANDRLRLEKILEAAGI